MKSEIKEIEINGVKYVEKGAEVKPDYSGDFYIFRTKDAGVFAGSIRSEEFATDAMACTEPLTIPNAIRIWYWSGAASLSEMAINGVKNPDKCKFSVPATTTVAGLIEFLPCTEKAKASILGVKSWRA